MSQTIDRLAYLGTALTGGLTFNFGDGNFYAIANGVGNSTLVAIHPRDWTVGLVGGLPASSFSGLAAIPSFNASPAGPLFAMANDSNGASTVYRIQLGPTLEATAVLPVGVGFVGGLAVSLQYTFQLDPLGLLGELVGISSDASGSAVINRISLQGPVTPVYEVGAEFGDGLAVVGSHTYVLEENLPVSVHITEINGSGVTAESSAEIVDEPPVALRHFPAFTAYQGFTTGPLTVASFFIPNGVEAGPVEYTATIDWRDGSAPEAGIAMASGNTVSVSTLGHTYTTLGEPVLGGKGTLFFPTVTLTNDAGDSAVVTDSVTVLPNVTDRVRVVGLGGPVQAGGNLFTSTGTITNLSNTAIPGPLFVVLGDVPAGVTLVNAARILPSGQPVLDVNIPRLDPGQTADIFLAFSNPAAVEFTPRITVIDGLGGAAPNQQTALAVSAPGFVANDGQADSEARFLAQGNGYSLFLTATDAVLALRGSDGSGPDASSDAMLRMQFIGANHASQPIGMEPLPGATNYLIGDDPAKWRTGIVSYGRVHYRDVYPGISLDYYGSASRQLEYDFTVAPGADPGVIRLAFEGADGMSLDAAGNLVLQTAAGDLVQQAPVIYQEIDGTRRFVAGSYAILGDGHVTFQIGPYEPDLPLVIDPVLVYQTYLGGSNQEVARVVSTDADGNTYVTGYTHSADFPTLSTLQPPPERLRWFGGPVAFITKLDAAGAVVYSTFLGGSGALDPIRSVSGDRGEGIAVSAAGEVYLTGITASRDFPTVHALEPEFNATASTSSFIQLFATTNAFVARLSADGSSLVWSTYLGGSGGRGFGLALDPAGDVYVAGTAGIGFQPTPGAASATPSGGFVAKLSGAGDELLYATYVPGTEIVFGTGSNAGFDVASGTVSDLAVDASGNAYIVGYTEKTDMAAISGAQMEHGGGRFDAFVAKLNAAGSALDYWTYLGGDSEEAGNAIAVDSSGSAYVVGSTRSSDFPIANALQTGFAGGGGNDANSAEFLVGDAFVTKLSPDGSTLVYSTYLGGGGFDTGTGIAVDTAGNAYVTGQAGSADFPTVRALQPLFGGDQVLFETIRPWGRGDAFLARVNAVGTALDYSTFLGGSSVDGASAVAVGPGDKAVVVGFTNSVDFPTLNALQSQASFIPGRFFGDTHTPNAFVARIAASGPGVLNVTNVPFRPTEAVPFTSVVAAFTDTDTSLATDYTAVIDWGDGSTSLGVVTSASVRGGSFVVSGTHTYAEEGPYSVTVTVHDVDGSIASVSATTFGQTVGGAVTYRVSVDTSALAGASGFLAFQLNPGAPVAQPVSAVVANVVSPGGTVASATSVGDASGSLATAVQLNNSAILNELRHNFTFGNSLTFDVRLEGDALSQPLGGAFGSTFSLTLLAADGVTPLQTADPSGAVLRITLAPDGSTRFVSDSGDGAPVARAAAVNTVNVADAPLEAVLVPFRAVEGILFTGTIATFTCANPASPASDFTATILWGDGTAASEGTIVADGGGRFHVIGSHTYVDAGDYPLRVVVRSKGGSAALAVAAPATAPIDGLQAPRVVAHDVVTGFVAADFNGDGKTDLAVWRRVAPISGDEALYVLLGNGDGSFQDAVPVTAPAPSVGLGLVPVAADFNDDGNIDLIAAEMVFLANGDGTFQAGIPFDAGPFAGVSFATADLDGDARLDLVALNGASQPGTGASVQVLLGNGDGSFAPRVDYGFASGFVGSTLDLVVADDFTSDGKTDLVINLFFGGHVLLFRNNGDGTFGTAELLTSTYTLGTTADVDRDGHLDLVGTDGSHVRVLFGNGDGGFPRVVRYEAGDRPDRAILSDLDGDGIPELIVATRGSVPDLPVVVLSGSGMSILKGNADGGFANAAFFAATVFEQLALAPGAIQAADFNGDGNIDIALGHGANISVFFGQGGASVVVAPFSFSGAPLARGLDVADFNGDGQADVALAGLGATVLLGNGDGTFVAPDSFQTSRGLTLLTGDVNGDGIPDIINGNWLRRGRGDGGYHSPAINLGIGGAFPVAQPDLDGDGKLDLVTVEFNSFAQQTTVRMFLGNGDGSFTAAGSFAINEPAYTATVADFNRDGHADLVLGQDTALSLLLGNGDGSFGAPSRHAVPNNFQFRGVATADFNADGNPDLAGAAFGGVSILLGNGDGTFIEPVSYATGPFAHGLGVGDFNGDGVSDLVAPDRNNRTVSLLLGNGDGSFRAGVTFSTGSIASSGVVAADLTGDGKLDFVIEDRTGFSGIMLFPGNGDGTFAPPLVYAVGEGLFPSLDGGFLRALAVRDVDNDGRPDLLVTDSSGIVSVFLAQPGGLLAAPRIYLADRGATQALASDLNRDGRPDLVVVHGGSASVNITARVHVFLNRGDGTFQPSGDYDLQTFTIVTAALGDFDGDGITDIVVDVPPDLTLSFNPRRALLRGAGDGTFVTPQFTVVPGFLSPQKLLADDVNGDGKLDLVGLAQVFQGGQVEITLGNGDGSFQAPIPTGPLPGIDLSGAAGRVDGFAAADFTSDGRLDLVVGTTDLSARVLPGNGDGTFAAPIESPMGARSLAFATGDIDGDGKTDLVAVNADVTVSLLLGNGDGAFRRPITYLSNGPFNSGYDVAVADINGDGRPDVIAGASNLLTVLPSAAAPAENVANAPLAATALDHRATQGAPFLGIVARFTDANPFETESDFAATITWGDGQTSAGTVRSDGEGGFLVLGSSVYAQTGPYNVTTLIVDEDGGAATASGVVTVQTGPDASLTAVGVPVAATARVPFAGVVATFTDGDPLGVTNDFLAMIDWGDGQTSLGRVQPLPGGGFEVLGTNTYAEPGSYTVAVSIMDTGGATASAAATAIVAPSNDPPLTASGLVFHATEQTTFSGVVATFTDADTASQVGDYTARIEWGDGRTSNGIVVADPAGGFLVTGSHGYREAGTYPVVVHITGEGSAADTAHSTGVVADAPLNALGRIVTATEGAAFTGVIASFTDANPFSTADKFTATILWGDGNISTGTIIADPLVPGRFEIVGANTYAAKGVFTIDVAIVAQGGATATARSLADVVDAPLSAAGVNVQTAPDMEFTAVVARFTDQNPAAAAADFSATIMWGDGTITPGAVTADTGDGFVVTGTYAYDATATYVFRVSILNLDGRSVVAMANATVTGASPQTTVEAIAATEGIPFVGLVASFTPASPTRLLGDFVATIDWGDGQTSAATVLMEPAAGRFHIVGETTYAEQGQYAVTITIADSAGTVATLSTSAAVADAPVVVLPTAAGTFTQAVARVAFSTVVTTIDDNGAGDLASDFTATITWEDGHVSSGLVTLDPGSAGRFRVLGSTIYAQAGTYPVSVALARQDGFTLTVSSTVAVAPTPDAAPFAVLAIPVTAAQAKPVTAVIATFRDDDPAATANDFSAGIAWGDGAASAGQVIVDPDRAGQFLVIGTHLYTDAGTFPLEVTIREEAGAPVAGQTTALVTPADVANSQPLARRDAYMIGEDKRLVRGRAAGVLANDADADGDKLTARVVRQPSSGTLMLNGNGSFRYTPDANFNGRDSFDYVVNDGQVNSTVATVIIKVRPAFDPVVLRQRTFFVPGMSGEKTVVRFDWLARDARFSNEVAIVRVDDAQGRIGGKLPGAAGYLQAALAQGRWQRVFPSGSGAGASREFAFKAGERFMVFIVQNATVEMLGGGKPPSRAKGRPPAFFMNSDANPFGFDHVRVDRLDNGYRLAWEDLVQGGDRDFDDVVIAVRTLTQLKRV